MSLTLPTSPVYHTSVDQKRKSQNAAKEYRFGSPKLRDLLREKCRIRMREARRACHEKSRTFAQTLAYTEIFRQELAELEKDINLQEEIYKELADELNNWFTEQLEEEEFYIINTAVSDELICPVCQKGSLERQRDAFNTYKCKCTASFIFPGDVVQLQKILRCKIDDHEQKCLRPLTFFVEPLNDGSHLSAMCESCEYFCTI